MLYNKLMALKYQDKARGMLVGLAIGDALGAPVEFLPSPSDAYIEELDEEIAHFHDNTRLEKGAFTDDTSMALCIADSLLERGGYDSYDIMDRFVRWMDEGYRTYDSRPADDVGNQTRRAIEAYKKDPIVYVCDDRTEAAGNGAIMRLAPIIIANTFVNKKYPTLDEAYREGKLVVDPHDNESEFVEKDDILPTLKMAELSCLETHNSVAAVATTQMFATCLYLALHGLSKQNIANYSYRFVFGEEYEKFAIDSLDDLLGRAFKKQDYQFRDIGGYIVDTFAISLWGLLEFKNFEDGMLAVIRLGGDTDTNAACYGQLAGAYYGYTKIPEEWKKGVMLADELLKISDKLLKMSTCPVLKTRFEK